MNGFAALCTFIATFSPPLVEQPVTLPRTIIEPTNLAEQLESQDQRIQGPLIQGVIYFDGPISANSGRYLR